MPKFTTICESSSPFLLYRGTWGDGRSTADDFADRYSESSFHVTEEPNASLFFSFFGTAVGIYGAKRGNHGLYQVTVDDQQFPPISGLAESPEFNATLFSTSLAKGSHTVQLRNVDKAFTDIDYVSWETSVGDDNEPLIVNTIQDSHPAFIYEPANQWTSNPPFVGSYSGGDGHGTSAIGSKVRLRFQGDAIAVYGPSGPRSASQYSVQVDGRASQSYSATRAFHRPKQLLYFGANLGKGTHEIVFTLLQTQPPGDFLAIDYAEIYTTPSLGGSFVDVAGSSTTSSGAPLGLIVAVAITSALAVIALFVIAFIFVLYKKGKIRRHKGNREVDIDNPGVPTGAVYNSAGPSLAPFQVQPSSYQGRQAYYPQSASTSDHTYSNPYQPSGPSSAGLQTGGLTEVYHQRSPSSNRGDASTVMSGSSNTTGSGAALYPSNSIRKGRNRMTRAEGNVDPPPPAYHNS